MSITRFEVSRAEKDPFPESTREGRMRATLPECRVDEFLLFVVGTPADRYCRNRAPFAYPNVDVKGSDGRWHSFHVCHSCVEDMPALFGEAPTPEVIDV